MAETEIISRAPGEHSRKYVELLAQLYEPRGVHAYTRMLEIGEPFATVNWDESRRIAKKFYTRQNVCFQNCWNIARRTSLLYCEGFATPIIPVHHAWLINEAGEVIDPTYVLIDYENQMNDYFGVRLTRPEVAAALKRFELAPLWLIKLES